MVLSGNLRKVHVNNFASFKVLVVEVDNNKLGLGDSGKELIFSDFCVLSMALRNIFEVLLLDLLHLLNSLLSQRLHHGVIIITIEVRIAVLSFTVNFILHVASDNISLFIHHLLLDLESLVLDSFLHDHFIEDASCQLHVGSSLSTFAHS